MRTFEWLGRTLSMQIMLHVSALCLGGTVAYATPAPNSTGVEVRCWEIVTNHAQNKLCPYGLMEAQSRQQQMQLEQEERRRQEEIWRQKQRDEEVRRQQKRERWQADRNRLNDAIQRQQDKISEMEERARQKRDDDEE